MKTPHSIPREDSDFGGVRDEVKKVLARFDSLIPHWRVDQQEDGVSNYGFPTFPGHRRSETRTVVSSLDEAEEAWKQGINGMPPVRAWAVVPREHDLVVLDIDRHSGDGFERLRTLARDSGVPIPESWFTVSPEHPCYEATPRHGIHLWFRAPSTTISRKVLGEGIEFLTESVFVAGSKKYPDLEATRLVGSLEAIPEFPACLEDLVTYCQSFENSSKPVGSEWPVPVRSDEDDLFERAREAFPSRMVELFGVRGAHWEGDEFWTLSPLRPDRHPNSFSIRKDGMWHDFATDEGGDGIELVARARGLSLLEAARFIVGEPKVSPSTAKSAAADYPIRVQRISELQLREPEWLARGYLESGSLTQVFGKPGDGKSFVVLDLMLSIAAGIPWHGVRVKQGSVFYICGEGISGFRRRVEAWCLAHNVGLETLPFYYPVTHVYLDDPHESGALVDCIRAQMGGNPIAVVVDTLNRAFGAGDENSNQDMSRFIRTCDAMKDAMGCSVLLIHHSGHANTERARGASSLRGAVDHEYRVERNEDTEVISIVPTKCKDGRYPRTRHFELTDVALGTIDSEGEPVTSAVLKLVEEGSQEPKHRLGEKETKALRILSQLLDGKDAVPVDAWSKACRNDDFTPQSFHKVKESLMKKKIITLDGLGVVSLNSSYQR